MSRRASCCRGGRNRVFCGGDTSLSGDLRIWGELYQAVLAVLGVGVIGIGGRWLSAGKIVGLHPADPAPAQLAADLTGSTNNVVSLDFGRHGRRGNGPWPLERSRLQLMPGPPLSTASCASADGARLGGPSPASPAYSRSRRP